MTTSRKLEDIATHLDDMSLTLEEIKQEVATGNTADREKLESVEAEMEKATRMIESSLDPEE